MFVLRIAARRERPTPSHPPIQLENEMQKLSLFAFLAGIAAALAPAAQADVLSMSAAGFVRQCPCGTGTSPADLTQGVIVPTSQAKFYANVDFPKNGQKICGLTMVYEDINGNNAMSAKLFRKAFAPGGNPFNPPTVIASVASAGGVPATVRTVSNFAVNAAKSTIDETTGFYFVEVATPTINLNLLGVQVDYRAVCPVD
jgi:hypothetical protein